MFASLAFKCTKIVVVVVVVHIDFTLAELPDCYSSQWPCQPVPPARKVQSDWLGQLSLTEAIPQDFDDERLVFKNISL